MADRLHSAAIHLLRRLRVEDEALGISAPRLSALSVLVFAGPRRVGELAEAEQVEPPTMTRLVDGMERDGYVAREPDPEDGRAVIVRATAKGIRALKKGPFAAGGRAGGRPAVAHGRTSSRRSPAASTCWSAWSDATSCRRPPSTPATARAPARA